MKFKLCPSLHFPLAVLSASSVALLSGCSNLATTATQITPQALHMTGSVHGGQQPISGAQVYLYSVAGTQAGASTSMLTTNGGFVTTDAGGGFNVNSDYACPTDGNGNQLPVSTYLLAVGGNPGLQAGATNSAIALMAALGPCTSLSASTNVVINEVSTAAAVTALQQFMTDGTHIGALTTSTQPGYSAVTAIPNAMVTVNNLVNLATGVAMTAPVNGNGQSPQGKLNALGNILAACINSAGPGSTGCATLFSATTPAGGTAPTDTITAMLRIAQNPGTNVATLYNQMPAGSPFQPVPATAPNDFSLGITYTGGGLVAPGRFVIDNSGNLWIDNCPSCSGLSGNDSIVGFSPAGAINTSAAGYTLNVHKPVAIAIDRLNGIWVAEAASTSQGNQLTRLRNDNGAVQYPIGYDTNNPGNGFPVNLTGTPGGIALVEDGPADAWVTDSSNGKMTQYKYDSSLLTTVATAGLANPTSIAADGLQKLYLIGAGSNTLVQYTPASGTFVSYTGAGLAAPVSLAVDGGDHIWTVDSSSAKVSELFGYDGTARSGTTGYSGINSASKVTIDGAGTAWIANCRASCPGSGSTQPDNIVHLSATGANLSVADGLQNAGLSGPTQSAIDFSGNLWISNTGTASMLEVVGVAAPVVTELETASSRHALGAINYLQNGSFDNGGQVKGDSSANAIPGWTYTSSSNATGATGVDNSNPFAGSQKLTYYQGSLYQASETQTVTVPNGTYLATCYVAGDPNHSSRTASIQAVSGANTFSNPLANLNYNFQVYSVPNITVTNGSLTLSLNDADSSGGYVGWDSCSVTQQ